MYLRIQIIFYSAEKLGIAKLWSKKKIKYEVKMLILQRITKSLNEFCVYHPKILSWEN